jgi:peptidoglycan hydrolase-like protein with peptidoglycan-binding domain
MSRIAFPLTLRMRRPEVGDLHQALTRLGFGIDAAERNGQRYGASTRAAVVRFQNEQDLPVTGEVDEATAGLLNSLLDGEEDPATPEGPTVPELPGGPTPIPAGQRVVGTVRHTDGSPVGGLVVGAFHRRLGGELPLGDQSVTTDRGGYTIGYALPAGTSKVDLFVRAVDDQRATVAVSPIAIGARAQEVFDLVVSDPRFRGPSEFARVTRVLQPQLAGVELADLDANDVALLVRNTGSARRSVTAWIASKRLSDLTAVDQESLFGLVRTENTAALPRLLRRTPARLRRSLTTAAESNVISHTAGGRADATVARLRSLAVQLSASPETPGSLGRLLATGTAASPGQQAGFLQRYADHDGPVRTLWEALRRDDAFGDAVVEDLQLSLRLGTVTANHPPLVKALRASGVRHAAQTAALDVEGWRRLLRTRIDGQAVGVPATIKGATAAERQDNYIRLLTRRTARAFPTAHVARTLKTLPGWQSSTTVAFLDANPDFNLLTAKLRSTLDAGEVVVRPDWDRAKLETELGTVQRVTRVAPRGAEEPVVAALLGNGYTSALSISRQSRATFSRTAGAALGDEAVANAVHRNAQFQVARAASGFAVMHPVSGGGYVAAVGGVSDAVESDPTWASLFGGVDYCRCEQCRSIYGPAAYLADLLGWLDSHDAGHRTAFERLDERRPDLQRIELSCENTNTLLPYVDLGNEILEVLVLNPGGRAAEPVVPQATTATSPELLADPEHLDPRAYDEHLAEAVFPYTLPFDLWGELGRAYFQHLGVRRSDLMEALRAPGAGSLEIDAERLRLSTLERRILTGATRHDTWEFWGYPSAAPNGTDYKTDLAVVSVFLDRAGIEYEQLLDLLHSRFVNPSGATRVTGAGCDTDATTVASLTDELLERAQRFLRLWRNRGWTMLDLDKALRGLAVTELDTGGLARLADLDRVLALTGAPLLEVLSWWGPIDTAADRPEKDEPVKSLYDRVFLDRSVDATAEDPGFPLALNAARTELANAPLWEDVRSLLQAALTVDSVELALLLDETVDTLPNEHRVVTGTTATLAGLSALYRHVSLAHRLGLTVGELVELLPLVGLDPFDPAGTDGLVGFVETTQQIAASPFSLVELHYLLEHDPQAETSVGVTDEAIGQTLVEVRDGLARVATDYAVVADPVGETTARYLAVLLAGDAVAAVMTALRTEADATNRADLEAVLRDNLGGLFRFDARALVGLEVAARFDVVVAGLAPRLQRTQGDSVIIEKVAGFAARNLDSVQDLLALRLRMTVGGREVDALAGLHDSPYTRTTATEIVPADDPEAFATVRRISKAALVLTRFGVEMDAQVWLFDIGVHSGLFDPLTVPVVPRAASAGLWDSWTRLVDLVALGKLIPGGEPSLVELLQLLEASGDPVVAEDAFRTALTSRTGWLREDLDVLTDVFAPAFPAGWRDGRVLRQLVDAFVHIGRLGVAAVQANGWASAAVGPAEAEQLRLAAKSKHDEFHWPAVARALRDPVRRLQRAALVAYLVARDDKYADEEDLYADLLIDVEMDPCMLTSRIKQAISTVQLFVQRAFRNLEDGIELTRTDRDHWEWMKNYRVWEAARRVFLEPENWIQPELRTDKSPLFERLENALMQGELDDAAAERAYTEYLEGLLKIARLEVMSVCHQFETDDAGTVDVLHVVARTKSQPREYYYRQWVDRRVWTPWEALDVDIEGDHVVLAVHDRRLFLFWPMAVQKTTGDEESTTNTVELKLAWIERLNEQWGGRKLTQDALIVSGQWDQLDIGAIARDDVVSAGEWLTYFRLADEPSLTIECRQAFSAATGGNLLGRFVLDPAGGAMVVDREQVSGTSFVAPAVGAVQRMRLVLATGAEHAATSSPLSLLRGDPADPEEAEVLASVPARGFGPEGMSGDGRIPSDAFGSYLYPHQYQDFTSQHGIFLDDDERTFHVMPEPVSDLDRLAEKDLVEPAAVGTADEGSDVLLPPEEEPAFEPDLPWDKQQERPILAGERGQSPVPAAAAVAGGQAAGGLAAAAAGDGLATAPDGRAVAPTPAGSAVAAAPNGLAIAAAPAGDGLAATMDLADSLTTAGLQQSESQLSEVAQSADVLSFPQTTKYRFALHYHPYAGDFMAELRRSGVAGLLDPDPDGPAPRLVRQEKSRPEFFAGYEPTANVLEPHPVQDIDFETGGAYAAYNWEVFFHVPMLIAGRLSQNQRFEDARRWFHFIFDPTNRSDDADPLRFWKIKPFYREPDAPIEDFLALAAGTEDSAEAEAARAAYDRQVEAWSADPFDPHRIAELRTTAYQKALVMRYLDNLIAWGDQLFRQDTIESVNEATGLYVLALGLLGDRPDALPPRSVPAVTTFEQVRGDLAGSVLANPLVQLENLTARPHDGGSPISPAITTASSWVGLLTPQTGPLLPGGPPVAGGFTFCLPPNENLLAYWDKVEDRLFKIRHCMNIEGVVRQLPLFEPPIDPGLLVRARAAGIDLSSALADLSAPLPYHRFAVMMQRTQALNQTVRGLGSALLSALEKSDAEALGALRANQELAVLEAVRETRKLAVDEARHTLTAAERSLAAVEQRRDYYDALIRTGWLPQEKEQVALLTAAGLKQLAASTASLIGGMLTAVPRVTTGASGYAASPVATSDVVDGARLAKAQELGSRALDLVSSASALGSSVLGVTSAWTRRAQEWQQQRDSADREAAQVEKQIEAATVRVALAERDLDNHERQIENSRSVRDFLEQKFTDTELYQWMVGQLSTLYFQSYQLAYDLAKRTERAYRQELALPDATFVQFGYWDSLRKGLLAGERLQYDLERMDVGYLENNLREYEITQHVSLAQLDPVALTQLRTSGGCEFSVPEALFDVDYPGQYLRRIKSVSVTVPCVTGPYTGVPLRLTLVSSRIRVDPTAAGAYPMETSVDDPRFQLQTGGVQSVAISGGRDDGGLFILDHRDERYLPFEGSGAISDWNLTLTSAVPTFEWDTITDVVLHVRYTAREGGDLLRAAALTSLQAELDQLPLRRAFSARSEFPSEWNAFLRPAGGQPAVLRVELAEQLFPYLAHGAGLRITGLDLVALVRDPGGWRPTDVTVTTAGRPQTVSLAGSAAAFGGEPTAFVAYAGADPGSWEVTVPDGPLGAPAEWADDLILIVTYQLELDLR